jgi:hypothetical protein
MPSRTVAGLVLAVFVAGAGAGCGSAPGTPPGHTAPGSPQPAAQASSQPAAQASSRPAAQGAPATRCGTVRTAAGVPVEIEVLHGAAACAVALAVERGYTSAVASGKVAGNGGGAPIAIRGWLCQGFNTPQVLATGHASACRKNGTEILAVLPTPGASPAG